jgi:hypothetical protein
MTRDAPPLAERFRDLARRVQREALDRCERLNQIGEALETHGPEAKAIAALQASAGELDRLRAEFSELVQQVQAVHAERERRIRYDDPWLQEQVQALRADFAADPATGCRQWTKLAIELLGAHEFAALESLDRQDWPLPATLAPAQDIRRACAALATGDTASAEAPVARLWSLLELDDERLAAVDDASRVGLLVLLGQVMGEKTRATRYLLRARRRWPAEGRLDAALSDVYRLHERGTQALAYAQQAVDKAPALPQAHLALGACQEAGRDARAKDAYRRAARMAANAPRPLAVFERALCEPSARAWLALARAIGRERPQEADVALQRAEARDWDTAHPKAMQLRIDLAHGREDVAAEAQGFFQWGRELYHANDLAPACEKLQAAIALEPGLMEARWILADALVVRSRNIPPPTLVDEKLLDQALDAWEAARARQLPEVDGNGWAYFTRGLICEARGLCDGADTWRELWAAVGWVEQSLLFGSAAARLAYLASLFRRLGLESNALDACEQGLELDPDDELALKELCVVRINLGEWQAAFDLLARLTHGQEETAAAEAPNEWVMFIKAVILNGLQRPREALEALREPQDIRRENLSLRRLRATTLRLLGRGDEARREFRQILEFMGRPGFGAYEWEFAGSALELAGLEADPERAREAASLYEALEEQRCEADEALRGRGVALLMGGRTEEGRTALEAGIALANTAGELDELLRGLEQVVDLVNADVLAAVRGEIEARRRGIAMPSPGDELARAFSLEATAARASMQASGARLWLRAGRVMDAARAYVDLMRDDVNFPAARHGLVAAAQALLLRDAGPQVDDGSPEPLEQAMAMGDWALAAGESWLAASLFARVASLAPVADPPLAQVATHRAGSAFTAAVGDDPGQDETVVQGWLEAARGAAPGVPRLWALVDAWRRWAADAQDAAMRRRLALAADRLPGLLAGPLGLEARPDEGDEPLPLLLELGPDLIPEDTDNWPLFKEGMPDLQERIDMRLGVAAPGLQGRPLTDAGWENRFVISIAGTPVALGQVPAGARFAQARRAPLQEAGVPADDIREGEGETVGCWVPQAWADRLEAAGIEVLDPDGLILHEVGAVMWRHLPLLFGLPRILHLVDTWREADKDLTARIDAIQADADRLAGLARLMLEALAEPLPLRPPARYLDLAERFDLRGAPGRAQALADLRLGWSARLRGRQPELRKVDVGATLEAELGRWRIGLDADGLALPRDRLDETIAALFDRAGSVMPEAVAFVVDDASLRPALASLTGQLMGGAPVLTRREASTAPSTREGDDGTS